MKNGCLKPGVVVYICNPALMSQASLGYIVRPCLKNNNNKRPGAIADVHNPKLLGRWRSGRWWFEASLGKKLARAYLN
jgi:hypothetical protein